MLHFTVTVTQKVLVKVLFKPPIYVKFILLLQSNQPTSICKLGVFLKVAPPHSLESINKIKSNEKQLYWSQNHSCYLETVVFSKPFTKSLEAVLHKKPLTLKLSTWCRSTALWVLKNLSFEYEIQNKRLSSLVENRGQLGFMMDYNNDDTDTDKEKKYQNV